MIDFLREHAAKGSVSFHMPGHKGSAIFKKYGFGDLLEKIVDIDITEIPGADNLFQGEGIIKAVQDRYAGLYGARRSYLLINGTSGGLIASILASAQAGGKLIMARNSHKSIFNALALGGLRPVYAYPEVDEEYGVAGRIEAKTIAELIGQNPDAAAVILPSPNYYGICSDVAAIAETTHAAGKILIIDQAHGAHLKFFHRYGCGRGLPMAAEDCGADIVVNSVHKTLASLTQSAVLNLCSARVDRYALEDRLQAVQSTSPSYILMAFLDANAKILEGHGAEAMKDWRENIDYFYGEAGKIPGLSLMGTESEHMDRTKINVSFRKLGIGGERFERLLLEDNIFPELYTGELLMLMTGIGNTREHMDRALAAMRRIAKNEAGKGEEEAIAATVAMPGPGSLYEVPKTKEFVSLDEAVGLVCAGSVIPYPPGIPLICPGEEITPEAVDYIKALRGAGGKVIGLNDENRVLVGIEAKK